MAPLRNYNLHKNVNFTVFLKKIAFIFLSWSCLTYIDVVLYQHIRIVLILCRIFI
ncbi:unnamed protein product [Plasmodium vivax]|uniref:(malaria parasite P. vivax) hypothetical protein n=1 Tax=Plasmodium vivax TaxID=5855 RepID=A0A8S4HHJ5_PLAVI|nr:unnamed protein product [Plasmodium vivax]